MEKIVLMPYTRRDGIPTFRNSELAAFFDRMEEDGWLRGYVHDQTITDRDAFVYHITQGNCMFWCAYVGTDPVGVFWLNRFEGRNARGHFVFLKDVWGTDIPIRVGREIIQLWVETEYKGSTLFDTVIGVMPETNPHAISYIERLGGKSLGKVYNYFRDENDECVAGVFIYFTKGCLKQ